MKKLFVFGLALCAVCTMGRVASASVLASNMTFNGIQDVFVDESRSNIVDNGDGVLSAGDAVYGYVSFDDVSLDGAPNTAISGGRLVAVFAIEVTAETATGSKIFLHGASTVAGATFGSLLDPALLAEGVGGAPIAASSMFLILESTTSASPVNNATDLTFFSGAAWDIMATGGVVAANGDFLQVFDQSSTVTGPSFAETASLSVLQHALGGTVQFLSDVGADDFTIPLTSLADAFGQIAIRSATINANTNVDAGSWALQDNGNFAFNGVPEPSALALWGVLAAFGLAGGVRRRRKNA